MNSPHHHKIMSRQDDLSDNELDAFDASREKVLLEEAGDYLARGNGSDDEDSEEEVMGLKYQNQESEEDDSEEEEGSQDEVEDEEDNDDTLGWGSKKNYYGGEDVSDNEDADEMAEEALRQQKRHLQDLDMDDFVDEDMMDDWKKTADVYDSTETKMTGPVVSEETVDLESLDDDEKAKYLAGSFPEFAPLLKEFKKLAPKLEEFKTVPRNPVVDVKIVALTAYLSSISSYFAIFVDKLRSRDHFSMKESPVMESILSSREVWRQAGELNYSASAKDVVKLEEEVEIDEDVEDVTTEDRLQTDSENEVEEDDSEEEEDEEEVDREIKIDLSTKRTIRKGGNSSSVGDFTETSTPDSVDKEEKERRKKTLRFYTSKIDQSANKAARNEKFTGDLDLPYRERLFERQQRLVEEARKKGLGLDKNQLGEDLDSNDFNSDDEKLASQMNNDAEDYYESVKQGKKEKKEARRVAHEEAKRAARDGMLGELQDRVGEDGKRALNFQILKNKGLTPNRRNDNRNARVKKRKRYEQAKKKLKSVRQVYDDKNRGPYLGEKTGIKKGLSRSVKLV